MLGVAGSGSSTDTLTVPLHIGITTCADPPELRE